MPYFAGQISLGELYDKLKTLPPDIPVAFDWCDLMPTTLASYRGYYDQIALGFDNDTYRTEVRHLVTECENAIGHEFTGWKGGDYRMDRDTGVWVANPGKCHGIAITKVKVKISHDGKPYWVTLKTKRVDK